MRRKRLGAATIQPRSAPKRAATNRASTMGADGALNIRKWNVTAWVFCAPNTTSTVATSSAAINFSELMTISFLSQDPVQSFHQSHYHPAECSLSGLREIQRSFGGRQAAGQKRTSRLCALAERGPTQSSRISLRPSATADYR